VTDFPQQSKDKIAETNIRSALAGWVPSDLRLFVDTLRRRPYLRRVLADRHWLEEALEHKDEVISFLSSQQRKEDLRVFREEFDQFAGMTGSDPRLRVSLEDINPQLSDRASVTPIDRHYTYHPAWAARVLAKTRPNKHIDISSIVNFCAVVSAFIPVEFYDFRPAPVELDGLYTGAADLTRLHFANDSITSLSCMHVIEHIGLGRYGDPLDPDGDLKAIGELVRVLAPGGDLMVATPVGRPRVAFNAHRVYDHEAFARYFAPLELVEFALIEEQGEGGLIVAPPAERVRAESYGCGCFWFRKPKTQDRKLVEAVGAKALDA
jgi:SAM-dependent methyltransferase